VAVQTLAAKARAVRIVCFSPPAASTWLGLVDQRVVVVVAAAVGVVIARHLDKGERRRRGDRIAVGVQGADALGDGRLHLALVAGPAQRVAQAQLVAELVLDQGCRHAGLVVREVVVAKP
jgi:hypothetical protein